MSTVGRFARVVTSCLLVLVAALMPAAGYGASEHYKSQKVYGLIEGDWLMLFSLIAGACTLWAAYRVVAGAPDADRSR